MKNKTLENFAFMIGHYADDIDWVGTNILKHFRLSCEISCRKVTVGNLRKVMQHFGEQTHEGHHSERRY